jgi:hypothetical protein
MKFKPEDGAFLFALFLFAVLFYVAACVRL